MKKALVVGINHYEQLSSLFGCVDDAHSLKAVLERNADGSVNFSVRLLTGTGPTDSVPKALLKEHIKELFAGDSDIALLFFAGHGHVEDSGGYILCSDATAPDDGVSLSEVMAIANRSQAKNRIIILDSCNSGSAGASPVAPTFAEIKEGTTILTASTADQYASESNGSGVFTSLLTDALGGAAANLLGEITPGSIYAHVDQSLGPWDQRPVFKTNVKNFVSLRRVQSQVDIGDIQRILEFFPKPGAEFPLDPTYEPERSGPDPSVPPPDPNNVLKFAVLQKYNRVGLVVPVGAKHMWHAAMGSKSCRLTALGEHYRRLVERGRI